MIHARMPTGFSLASVLGLAVPCFAQTTFSSTNKYAWGENVGWTNWSDAGSPIGNQGAALVPLIAPVFMKGYVWGENIGWIDLGDGTPANGVQYSNANGTDFGINVALNGDLSGYAWGENVGWINFSGGAMATPPQPARYFVGLPENRLKGYVWSENVGWINLDDATHYVAALCAGDFNGDGFLSGDDFDAYLVAFESGNISADFNADGFISGDDFDQFVAAFGTGC